MYQTYKKKQAPIITPQMWKTIRVSFITILTVSMSTVCFADQLIAPNKTPKYSPADPFTVQGVSFQVQPKTTRPQPQSPLVIPVQIDATILPKTEDATVHIICTSQTSKTTTRAISGSGVIIDPRGIVLTNAHILSELASPTTRASCVARRGSPSANPLSLKLLYISPKWITEYAAHIFDDALQGTGENDFAIGLIVNSDSPLNPIYPYVPIEQKSPFKPHESVLSCSYPAEFISGDIIASRLFRNCSFIETTDGFTFGKNTLDAVSLGGTILARAGVSGGPIVDVYGNLRGIMATASRESSTQQRSLTAITVEHIFRSFASSENKIFSGYISQPIETLIQNSKKQLDNLAPLFKKKTVSTQASH